MKLGSLTPYERRDTVKTISAIKPPGFKIINTNGRDAEIFFAENIAPRDMLYEYDLYVINAPYRDSLYDDIAANYSDWLARAKERNGVKEYTAFQLVQQDITDLQLLDIKTQQLLTELELQILEGF